MLILSRKRNEDICVTLPDGNIIKIVCVEIRGDKVRIGIDAPKNIPVHRGEIQRQIDASKGNANNEENLSSL